MPSVKDGVKLPPTVNLVAFLYLNTFFAVKFNFTLLLSEIFVPMGDVILKSYDKSHNETVTKSSNPITEEMNIVVLVNENSASATEIFAAAIQDNEVGTIIGTKTFGKGIMQEVEPLAIGGAIKITIEEFKTPNGNKIHEVGITPDIEVENDELVMDESQDKQLQAAIDFLKK